MLGHEGGVASAADLALSVRQPYGHARTAATDQEYIPSLLIGCHHRRRHRVNIRLQTEHKRLDAAALALAGA